MFPNPQDALPLPSRPSLEAYKKIAKDLARACKSGDPQQINEWAEEWADRLLMKSAAARPFTQLEAQPWTDQLEEFAIRKMGVHGRKCALADAQFVIARSHGFESWPKFARHIAEAARENSSQSRFEAAADAIVNGDAAMLKRLLREEPALIRTRSSRQHGATLLHYVAANGIENYRQKTPKNIVEIAGILLDAGAEVDATANVYGGGSTVLGLAATSIHPERAGLQEALLQVLLNHGARMDQLSIGGNRQSMVAACFANGRARAAEFLASRGAPLDLLGAAALGRLDAVKTFLREAVGSPIGVTQRQIDEALRYACGFGRRDVVEFLLGKNADLLAHGGDGQTPLHWAVFNGQPEMVKLLLAHDAPLEVQNIYGGTALGQALWSAAHSDHENSEDENRFVAIIEALIAAGAAVPARHPPVNARVDNLLRQYGSEPEPTWYWYGEKPRRPRPGKSQS